LSGGVALSCTCIVVLFLVTLDIVSPYFLQAYISCTGSQSVSHVLLWQPSDCVRLMIGLMIVCAVFGKQIWWWWCRARRAESQIQQMLWKVNYSDIVFINTVRIEWLLVSDTGKLSQNNCKTAQLSRVIKLSQLSKGASGKEDPNVGNSRITVMKSTVKVKIDKTRFWALPVTVEVCYARWQLLLPGKGLLPDSLTVWKMHLFKKQGTLSVVFVVFLRFCMCKDFLKQ